MRRERPRLTCALRLYTVARGADPKRIAAFERIDRDRARDAFIRESARSRSADVVLFDVVTGTIVYRTQ